MYYGSKLVHLSLLMRILVNGLQGYVAGITEDGPVVKFAYDELPVPKVKCTGIFVCKKTLYIFF